MIPTRRRLLGGMALAIPAAALPLRRVVALEPPPETLTVRLPKQKVICFAPQYVLEELLRAEGFAEIRYVEIAASEPLRELALGDVDFGSSLSVNHIIGIDKGAPITIVSGVHGGCYELFVHGGIRTIADLKGKGDRRGGARSVDGRLGRS